MTAIAVLLTSIVTNQQETVTGIPRLTSRWSFTTVKGGTSIQLFDVVIKRFGVTLAAFSILQRPFATMDVDGNPQQALYNQMCRPDDLLSCAFDTPSGRSRRTGILFD